LNNYHCCFNCPILSCNAPRSAECTERGYAIVNRPSVCDVGVPWSYSFKFAYNLLYRVAKKQQSAPKNRCEKSAKSLTDKPIVILAVSSTYIALEAVHRLAGLEKNPGF